LIIEFEPFADWTDFRREKLGGSGIVDHHRIGREQHRFVALRHTHGHADQGGIIDPDDSYSFQIAIAGAHRCLSAQMWHRPFDTFDRTHLVERGARHGEVDIGGAADRVHHPHFSLGRVIDTA